MIKMTLAAFAVLSGVAHAGVASDQAWARFGAMRPAARADGTVEHFNRLVFSTYRNVALFVGAASQGANEFLEDFLLQFPATVVHAGHAALVDPEVLLRRVNPTELNLVVLHERYSSGTVDVAPLLDRVERMNADGYVVKIVVIVNDADAVLPSALIYRGEFFDFGPGYQAQLRESLDNFVARPSKSGVWNELINQAQRRRKLAVLKLSQLVLDPNIHLAFMLGSATENAGLLSEVQSGLEAQPAVLMTTSINAPLAIDEPKRRLGLNLIRVLVGPAVGAQWPRPPDFWRLLHDVRQLNANGVHAKVVVESTMPFEVPSTVRAQALVMTTAKGCEGFLIAR